MKILLTGSKGFIGSHLQPKLEKLGHKVIGMDIKNGRDEDIRNESFVKHRIGKFKPDVIVHLAALTGVRSSIENPDDYFKTNIIGTYWLLKWADYHKVKNFLFTSSSSVYGLHKPPLKETMECNHQVSPYAVSKKTGEMLCKLFSNLSTIVFRPFTVYGENGREDMVIRKIINCGITGQSFDKYGEGNSTRGYVNIKDLCRGIIKLLDYKPKNKFDIINLGGKEKIELNDLIKIIKGRFPNLEVRQVEMPETDMPYNYADISKAKRLLGWQPKTNFKEEIIKLCKLYQKEK